MILGLALILLIILWILVTIIMDLSTVSIKKNPSVWIYMLTCYCLNLFWTLAVFFLRRISYSDYLSHS